jgi:hypothetical protein
MRIQKLFFATVCCLMAANIVSSGQSTNRWRQLAITPQILHQDQAAKDKSSDAGRCLDETDWDIDWNENGKPPVVRIMFQYENTCTRPVSCKVTVESGHRPSHAKKNDYTEWQLDDTIIFKFTLAVGETRKLLATLRWSSPPATTPGLRWPHLIGERDLEFMQCSFADAKLPG